MTKTAVQKAVACLLSAATLMGAVAPAASWAANNRLSNIQRIATTDGSVQEALDLVLNTDWDYDASVVQSGTGINGVARRTLDRAYVEALVRQSARMLFVMTNGRHRIGKVHVFKNSKFGNDVDIRLLNVPGRSNASISGWRVGGDLTTNNYITNRMEDKTLSAETPEETGEVVAHELGHYVYGLLDEYREAGKPCEAPATQAGGPCQDDIVKPSAMNDQSASYRLSVPSDYAGQQSYRTAQSRGYGQAGSTQGSSAWEMLVGDPANDAEIGKGEHGGRRIRFDAFKNIPVPTLEQLKLFSVREEAKPSRFDAQRGTLPANSVFAGYDSQLQLIFDQSGQVEAQPRNVIIVDRTVPEATLKQFIEVAQGLVNRAPANARYALVASPASGTPQFLAMDAAGKGVLKNALEQLTQTEEGFDLNTAYAAGKALVTAARASGGVDNAADIDTFSLLTANTTTVPEGLGATARNDKIAINPIGLSRVSSRAMPSSAQSLATLARDSGGTSSTAKSVSEAIKEGDKALKDATGAGEALIASDLSDDVLAAGARHDVRFKVGPTSLDGTVLVNWYFDKADQAKLRFSCISAVNGQTVPAVIQATPGSDEGEATCRIGNGRAIGEWIARVDVANGAGAAASVETEVIATPAGNIPVELGADVEGGSKSDNRRPHLNVKLAGAFPVIKAKVLVDILNADDGTLVRQFTLTEANDAGTNGDSRALDGVYTLDLGGQLPAGSYVALIDAATDANSLFNPNQRFALGATQEATSVGGEIARQTEVEFRLEAGATGVGVETAPATPPGATTPATTPTATTPATATTATDDGRSGGCTVGNGSDAGLLLLLGLAGSMLMLRRGRRATRRIRGD